MLTAKQARFVAEYLKDPNATRAAVSAGYTATNADVTGPRMLRNVGIAAAIAAGQAKLASKLEISAESVLREMALLGFANMGDYIGADGTVDLTGLTRDKWAAVSEVTIDHYTEGNAENAREVKRVKFKLSDKRAALVDLGKHLNLFNPAQNHKLVDESEQSIPLPDLVRRLAFLLTTTAREAQAAPAAPPIKH